MNNLNWKVVLPLTWQPISVKRRFA